MTVKEFLDTDFYGFIEATVIAPDNEYIGLLPIKLNGKLICPGELNRNHFIALYEGQTLNLEVTKWYKEREAGKIYIKSGLPYKLKVSFNKRNRTYDGATWIGTLEHSSSFIQHT